ncbi:MAG: AAA family ATPase [Spirochaetes bacterium]|nr:AAA family ATPase [Spirochaetota bacterium]
MINLNGFTITEEIFKSYNSTIYRGIKNDQGLPVIVKLLNHEFPSENDLSYFKREFEIMSKLTGDGIIRVYSLEKYDNTLAIIMEDFGGESLAKILHSTVMELQDKLSLMLRISDILIQVHKQNIMHKDVNPSNIIWNPSLKIIKIIDFGISSEVTKESSRFVSLQTLEGTLDYISPEQTGRMNRPVDYRTDLYSMGVMFYEILTGQLPFKGNDDIEKIYSHIAQSPVPPEKISPEIPEMLSVIILKLLSKNAEERYQSALGVKTDLQKCKDQLKSKGRIDKFKIAENDFTDKFQISGKIYGRNNEIENLIEMFDQISEGRSGIMFISGYSGVGKSALVNEIQKPVSSKKGRFITGKFDKLEQNIPYSALIRAFNSLIQQMQSEPEDQIKFIQHRLDEILGLNAQVIIDLIPDLENLIGQRNPVPDLSPIEAQNRFQLVFRDFIQIFADKDSPLVIFLDDLQWSDVTTLNLLNYLVSTEELKYVFFIGAYRDNEVKKGHPLLQVIQEMENKLSRETFPFRRLVLKPLKKTAVNHLISDTFRCTAELAEPLTSLVYRKTDGNPFFTNQLLNTLHHRGAFTYVPENGCWNWDLNEVGKMEISENVIDLLVNNLKSLPDTTLIILKLASCFGDTFNMKNLSSISGRSVAGIGNDLLFAIEKEIIFPLSSIYRLINIQNSKGNSTESGMDFSFMHDRIHQAIYSLLTEEEKSRMHLKIGYHLKKNYTEAGNYINIFDLVNHLNIGKELITSTDERLQLSELNLQAGKKAVKSTAFNTAADYFETGLSLLSEEDKINNPHKYFELSFEYAEAVFLSGKIDKAELLCENLFELADDNFTRASVYNLKAAIMEFQGNLPGTVSELRKGLELYDIKFPDDPEQINGLIQERMGKLLQWLAQTEIENLVNLPEMTDRNIIMTMRGLFLIVPAAIQCTFQYYIISVLMMFELTIQYGITGYSAKCFADCGVIIGLMTGDYKTGYKLGEAAFAVIRKYKLEAQKPSVFFIFTYISYWIKHYSESIEYYDMSFRTGLETGDISHAAYAIAHKVYLMMYVGRNLTECRNDTLNAISFIKDKHAAAQQVLAEIVLYAIQKLQYIPGSDEEIDFEKKDNEITAMLESIHNITSLCRFFQHNAYINFIMGSYDAAEMWCRKVEPVLFASANDFPLPDFHLVNALLMVKKYRKSSSDEEKNNLMDQILSVSSRLEKWSSDNEINFAHKHLFLLAEIAILKNEPVEVIMNYYKAAYNSIGEDDFINMKAVISEQQGLFWHERKEHTISKAYIREAHYLYKQWGAFQKVYLLEKEFTTFFAPESPSKSDTTGTSNTGSRSGSNDRIDTESIIKATQAVSGEIKLEKLLGILMETIIENAGAQHGCLLLVKDDGELYVDAKKSINSERISVMQQLPFREDPDLCPEIINYVLRKKDSLVIGNAYKEGLFTANRYIVTHQIKSLLCIPVMHRNILKGIVYLENNLSDNVFTSDRVEIINIISSQAAISIDNARLYENMEEIVKKRTLQLKEANDKLKELSLLDPLTNLHNRRYIMEFVTEQSDNFLKSKIRSIHHANKRNDHINDKVLGVFLIDIDYFKNVNDTYGHAAGDNVLISFSSALRRMIRTDDFIVRWGGEEFLIILNNTQASYLDIFSRLVLDTINSTPLKISADKEIYKTCSIGYSQMPIYDDIPDFITLEQSINISDYALYMAKESGRNRAAYVETVSNKPETEECRNYLSNLSKNTELNTDYINIRYILPENI